MIISVILQHDRRKNGTVMGRRNVQVNGSPVHGLAARRIAEVVSNPGRYFVSPMELLLPRLTARWI